MLTQNVTDPSDLQPGNLESKTKIDLNIKKFQQVISNLRDPHLFVECAEVLDAIRSVSAENSDANLLELLKYLVQFNFTDLKPESVIEFINQTEPLKKAIIATDSSINSVKMLKFSLEKLQLYLLGKYVKNEQLPELSIFNELPQEIKQFKSEHQFLLWQVVHVTNAMNEITTFPTEYQGDIYAAYMKINEAYMKIDKAVKGIPELWDVRQAMFNLDQKFADNKTEFIRHKITSIQKKYNALSEEDKRKKINHMVFSLTQYISSLSDEVKQKQYLWLIEMIQLMERLQKFPHEYDIEKWNALVNKWSNPSWSEQLGGILLLTLGLIAAALTIGLLVAASHGLLIPIIILGIGSFISTAGGATLLLNSEHRKGLKEILEPETCQNVFDVVLKQLGQVFLYIGRQIEKIISTNAFGGGCLLALGIGAIGFMLIALSHGFLLPVLVFGIAAVLGCFGGAQILSSKKKFPPNEIISGNNNLFFNKNISSPLSSVDYQVTCS